MKIKNKTLVSFLPIIVFIVYTVITFIIWGDNKEDGFWLGWTFSLIATGIAVAVPYLVVKDGKELTSILNGFSIPYFTYVYFGAQLVLGLLCMILNENCMPLQVILEVILHSIYAFLMIGSVMGKNVISDLEQKQKEKVFYIKSAASDLKLAANKIQDEELKKKAEKVAEIAKYSDPMSNPSLAGIENTISVKIEDLKTLLDENKIDDIGKILDEIESKFLERNEKCKLLK